MPRHLLAAIALLAAPLAHAQAPSIAISPQADQPILTMVNVLTPGPEGQDAVIAQLNDALANTMATQPGFISGGVHRSLDSDHVVNYAQWRDMASLQAFVVKLQAGEAPAMAKVFTLATPDYHPYEVVAVHRGTQP